MAADCSVGCGGGSKRSSKLLKRTGRRSFASTFHEWQRIAVLQSLGHGERALASALTWQDGDHYSPRTPDAVLVSSPPGQTSSRRLVGVFVMPSSGAAGALCEACGQWGVAATHKRAGEPPQVAAGPARIARPNALRRSIATRMISMGCKGRKNPSGAAGLLQPFARSWPAFRLKRASLALGLHTDFIVQPP